jgi:hypothetical protein
MELPQNRCKCHHAIQQLCNSSTTLRRQHMCIIATIVLRLLGNATPPCTPEPESGRIATHTLAGRLAQERERRAGWGRVRCQQRRAQLQNRLNESVHLILHRVSQHLRDLQRPAHLCVCPQMRYRHSMPKAPPLQPGHLQLNNA